MAAEKKNRKKLIILFLIILLSYSCSSSTNYQILSTFFDGVNDPNEKPKEKTDSLKVKQTVEFKTQKNNVIEKTYIYHPPFKNRLCKDCHNLELSNQLVLAVPNLCYKCHENYSQKNPSLHGPVAMGNCKVCHSPHFAENKFLLIRTGRNLCLHCHESTYVYENKHHFATDEYQCLDCHDPHSGKDRFLLTK